MYVSSGSVEQEVVVPVFVKISHENKNGLLGQMFSGVPLTISTSTTECNIDIIIFC